MSSHPTPPLILKCLLYAPWTHPRWGARNVHDDDGDDDDDDGVDDGDDDDDGVDDGDGDDDDDDGDCGPNETRNFNLGAQLFP